MRGKKEGLLRKRAEKLFASNGEDISKMPPEGVHALVHELQVHKIELEMQNEELRGAQLELDEARARYSDLYEFAPVGYVTVDAEGVVREANLTAASMLGVERSKLCGARFGFFVKREDRDAFSQFHADVFVSGEKRNCEFQMELEDNPAQIFRLESILPDHRPSDDPVCFTALIDVTAQNEAEELRLEKYSSRASEAEKTRIARELHDDLGSLLKGLEVYAATLAKKLETDGSERVEDAQQISGWLEEAICQARDLAIGLHPIPDPEALFPALERLAEVAREAGLSCRLRLPGNPIGISDPEVANHLYRIDQEAVHNAIRHSGATEMDIAIDVDRSGALSLIVEDNGCGVGRDDVSGRSLGFQIMRYRARAIRGALKIGAGSPRGTEVVCKVPKTTKSSHIP